MKAVGLLIGLCVCLSSGQQWVVGSGLGPKDNLNTHAKLIGKNYAGNEMLRNNGIQNNLSYNSRRFFDDVNVKKGADTKQEQILSKNQPGDQVNPYQNECSGIVEIIKDLSLVTNTKNISEEKQNLKTLLSLIRVFILNNNLENAPFSVVGNEIRKILLSETDNSKPLRKQKIDLILQKFKEQELNNFLLEIRSRPNLSLQVVVLKLARLLHRLKQELIYKGLPRELVKLVINHAVQLSVPLVSYYFEKECKTKTQMYIVRNLEVALSLKLGGLQHVGSLDKLVNWGRLANSGNAAQVWGSSNRGNLGVLGGLGSVGGPWNEGYVNGVGGVINQGNPSGVGNLESLGGVGNQGSLAGLGNVENINSLETEVGPGISVNMGNQGNLGDQAGLIDTGNTQGINGFKNMISPKGEVGGPWNEGDVSGVGGVVNQENPSGLGNLRSLEGAGNQGSLAGLGNVENVNVLKTQVGPGYSVNMGNQGNFGDQGGPIDTGNTQGVNGFENMISPRSQGAVE